MDPLYVLRDAAIQHKTITAEGDYIVFPGNLRFLKSINTSFINRNTKEPYTLDTIYFAYQHADAAHTSYIAACSKANQKFVSFADNKDLKAFLKGEIETSPSILPPTAPSASSLSIPAAAPAAPHEEEGAERGKKRSREEPSAVMGGDLQDLELDEKLLEEKKQVAERLEAPKASLAAAIASSATMDDATLDGMSSDMIALLKMKRMKKKMQTITVVEDEIKKPVQKGGFVQADAVVTKKITDRERQLSSRSSILNTNGKKNFTDIIQAVTRSQKKELEKPHHHSSSSSSSSSSSHHKPHHKDTSSSSSSSSQKGVPQTYDRYNVKEDQNWWKDKLKTNLEDFEIDTRGTFADGGLGLDKAPASAPTTAAAASSSVPSAPTPTPSASRPQPAKPASASASSSSASSRPSQPAPRPSSSRPSAAAPSSSSSKHHPSSSKSSHSSSSSAASNSSSFHAQNPPIIIVPAALTSLITIYNAQDFLQEGKFVPVMTKKGETPNKPASVLVKHSPKITNKDKGLPDTFQIVDNTTRMSPKDWNRVVAVFVLGQAWQFKDWQWSTPVELFTNVKGFYLRPDDTQVPPDVKSWNVKILTISKSKRHFDQTAALQFWDALEEYLVRKMGGGH